MENVRIYNPLDNENSSYVTRQNGIYYFSFREGPAYKLMEITEAEYDAFAQAWVTKYIGVNYV